MAIAITTTQAITCKNCGSTAVVKFGTYKGVQRYWCKACKRKFKGDDALFHMKVSHEHISSGLSMYYAGMSISDIRSHLKQEHDYYPPKSVVFQWVEKYTKAAIRHFKDYHPNVGDVWVADETVLKVGGHKVWLYDIIDEKTRFLLGSRLAVGRTTHDAQMLMEEAARTAGKVPKEIITDQNYSYLDGIERAFGADTEHVMSKGFRVKPNTKLIERWHGTLKERTKVMRGLKDIPSAIEFTDGFLVYYDYFRPHEALGGRTPADTADVSYQVRNWGDLSRLPVAKQTEIQAHLTPKGRIPKPRIALPKPHMTASHRRTRAKRGVFYEGHGMVSSHPFKGGKQKGRIL